MAPISLKTKLVLAISGMVFALVAAFSFLYVSKVVRQRTTQAYQTADFIAKEILERAGDVTHVDPATLGADPSDPQAVELAIAERLQHDPGLNSLFNSIVGFSDIVYDAAIADNDGRAIVDTNQDPDRHSADDPGRFRLPAGNQPLQTAAGFLRSSPGVRPPRTHLA